MSTDDLVMTTARLPQALVDRLDETAERLQLEDDVAWIGRVGRSSVLRMALKLGLDAIDEKHPPKRRRKR